jgi:hypothetical protein
MRKLLVSTSPPFILSGTDDATYKGLSEAEDTFLLTVAVVDEVGRNAVVVTPNEDRQHRVIPA